MASLRFCRVLETSELTGLLESQLHSVYTRRSPRRSPRVNTPLLREFRLKNRLFRLIHNVGQYNVLPQPMKSQYVHCYYYYAASQKYVRKCGLLLPIEYSVVCPSVCLSVTVSPTKMAEPIKMSFGCGTRVCPKNHVLDGGPDLPWEGANFWGEGGGPL